MGDTGQMRAGAAILASVGALLLLAASALADELDGPKSPLPVAGKGSSEAHLRAFERRTLGSQHAVAHAQQRALAVRFGRARKRVGTRGAPRHSVTAASPAPPTEVGGGWDPEARHLPVIAISVAMLPTGKVLMFAYPARPGYPGYDALARAFVWDPVTDESSQVDPPNDPETGKPTNIWCGGISFLADGRVLVTGGNTGDPLTQFHGLRSVFTFDPFAERWEAQPFMRQGRWYPSQLLMPDGRSLIIGGRVRPGDPDFRADLANSDLELFSPNGTTSRLADLPLGAPGSPPLPGLYPHTFWMPSGRAFIAGPKASDSWYLNRLAPGQPTRWTDVPDTSRFREWGTGVLLSAGRVILMGGSAGPVDGDRLATATTEYFDDSNPAAGWHAGPRMTVGRSHANSVLLPDGTVATIGGGYGLRNDSRWEYSQQMKHVELLDPRTGRVTPGPAQNEARTYHSTALLLPDGRVMSAGDDINGPAGPGSGTNFDTAEIYSPPYLFKGPRPRITSAPAAVRLGGSLHVGAAGAAAARAVLVAPGAVTHATDFNQRIVELGPPRAARGGGLSISVPGDADVAPPGYYMLFLLSAEGVPSVSRFVRVELVPNCPATTTNVILGTAGDDVRSGTASGDRFFMRAGNDRVFALAGDDCIDLGADADQGAGGGGDDLMLGRSGADRISGGSGRDRIRGGGGGDRITAGPGADRALGDSGNDRIRGGSGRDRIRGGGGGDRITAGSGADRALGDSGNDRIRGGSGNDRLHGLDGRDRISGGRGRDRISAGASRDRISARDRTRDRINCGSGRDRVIADRIDLVARNCERVVRR